MMNRSSSTDDIISRLTASDGLEFKFAVDSSGNYGYIKEVEGADTVIPFSKGLKASQLTLVYSGNSFAARKIDVKNILPNYASLTSDNFIIKAIREAWNNSPIRDEANLLEISYTASTGTINIPRSILVFAARGTSSYSMPAYLEYEVYYLG